MKTKLNDLAVIVPARLGSNRVKAKNLRLLNGIPLIKYILRTLKETDNLTNIYVNSDSEIFAKIAAEEGVKFYHRNKKLATSASLIDEYIYDFIKSVQPRHVAVVNPTSPFMDMEQLEKAWRTYAESDFDTLLSCERIQTHCFMDGEAINFSTQGKHPRSQDLKPVRALNFAITIWDCEKYVECYETNGWGVYTGKLGFFETEGWASIDIDYPEDFDIAELVARFLEAGYRARAEYPDYVEDFFRENQNIEN